MLDFSAFDNQDWLTFISTVVACLALLWNIRVTIISNRKTDKKLGRMEKSMADGLEKLSDKVNDVEGTTRYLTGYIHGWRRATEEESR